MQPNRPYALGHAADEIARLEKQAQLRDPSMRWLLAEAGIGPGMKVLDVGSGAGDVAFFAADLVGSSGVVVGVDANPAALERAWERVRATGRTNVAFVCGDLHDVAVDDDFDAVVGRLILGHQADPAAMLRSVTRHLRRGGIVAFQELHIMGEPWDVPPSPLHKQMWDWTLRGFTQAGIDMAMGLKLPRVFRDAGLPAPQMHLSAPVGGGRDWAAYEVLAMTFRMALELAYTRGLATADEVAALEVETFAERLRDEVVRQNGVITFSPSVGAWTRKP